MSKFFDYCKTDFSHFLKALVFCSRNSYFNFDDNKSFIYNFNEKMLDYTFMKTYKEWNSLGFYVKGGEHGLKFNKIQDYNDKDSDYDYYFDVSQVSSASGSFDDLSIYTLSSSDKNKDLIDNFIKNYNVKSVSGDKAAFYNVLIEYLLKDYNMMFDNNGAEQSLLESSIKSYYDNNKSELFKYESSFLDTFVDILVSYLEVKYNVFSAIDYNNDLKIKKVKKTLDNGITMYYHIGNSFGEEVKDDLFNSNNQENNNQSSERERLQGTNEASLRKEGSDVISNGRNDKSRRLQNNSNESREFRAVSESNISNENVNRNSNATSGEALSDNESLKCGVGFGVSDLGTGSRLSSKNEFNSRKIGQPISKDLFHFINEEQIKNKGNNESSGQVFGEQVRGNSETSERVEESPSVSIVERNDNISQVFRNRKQDIRGREKLNENISENDVKSGRSKSSTNGRNGTLRNLESSRSLKDVFDELKEFKSSEILFTLKEKTLIQNAIEYCLKNSDNNGLYTFFIDHLYDTLDKDENILNRDRLPYKIDFASKNGNSISKNRDTLADIISFYLDNNFNNKDYFNLSCLAYSVNRKLFLIDYGVKDLINSKGNVRSFENDNILEISQAELNLFDQINSNKDFLNKYGYDNNDEIIERISNIDSWTLNLQDNLCYTNRLFVEFTNLISNYIEYVKENNGVDIKNLSFLDDSYYFYEGLISIYDKLNNEVITHEVSFDKQVKAVRYEDILNLTNENITEIDDSSVLDSYFNIILDYNDYDNSKTIESEKAYRVLLSIGENKSFSNETFKSKLNYLKQMKSVNSAFINGELEVKELSNNYDKSKITDLDKKFENFDFYRFNDLNDIDKPFDKKLFFEMLDERKELRKYNNKQDNAFNEYVLCHFFSNVGDWYVLDYEKDGTLFGFVQLSNMLEYAELGYFSLDVILSIRNTKSDVRVNDSVVNVPMFLDVETQGVYGNTKLCEYFKDSYSGVLSVSKDDIDFDYIDAKNKWREENLRNYNKEINTLLNDSNNTNVDKNENVIKNAGIVENINENNSVFDLETYKNRVVSKEELYAELFNFTNFVYEKCLKQNDSLINENDVEKVFGEIIDNENVVFNYIDNIYELGNDKFSNSDLYDKYVSVDSKVIGYFNAFNNDEKYIDRLHFSDWLFSKFLNKEIYYSSEENLKTNVFKLLSKDGLDNRAFDFINDEIANIYSNFNHFINNYDYSINDLYNDSDISRFLWEKINNLNNGFKNDGVDDFFDYINYVFNNDFTLDNITLMLKNKELNIDNLITECENFVKVNFSDKYSFNNYVDDLYTISYILNLYVNNDIVDNKVFVNDMNDGSFSLYNSDINDLVDNENNEENDDSFSKKSVSIKGKSNNDNEIKLVFNEDGSVGFSSSDDEEDYEENDINAENNEVVSDVLENNASYNDNSVENNSVIEEEIATEPKVNDKGEKLDFVINDFSSNSISKSERFNNNINAINMLYKLENEDRYGTKEELEILSKFSGWGGLYEYFDISRCNPSDYDKLKNILNEDDYNSASLSSLDSFYTPNVIIDLIYQKISDMGFKGGNILEPSCAIGKFFGVMPRDMFNNSRITGVELDSISARICQKLYPSVNVVNSPFEDFNLKNKYDLIVGNVPFGESSPFDPIYNKQNLKIHDYFINKALANLSEGGICAIITSAGTMDKFDRKARESFSAQANFLGGVRLPNGVFNLDGKGTNTNADLLFFQKDSGNALKYNQEFVNSNTLLLPTDSISLSDNVFINKETKEEEIILDGYLTANYDKDFLFDMFIKQSVILNDEEDVDVLNKNSIDNYRYYYNKTKLDKLYENYKLWVENGKNENEKPVIDNLSDMYIFETYFDFNQNSKFNEKYDKLKLFTIENSNLRDVMSFKDNRNLVKFDKYGVIDESSLKGVYINDYFKNNGKNIIGEINTGTNQFGEIVLNNKIDNNYVSDIKNAFNSINGTYFKREEEKVVDNKIDYVSNNDYENNNLKLITPYTYFMFNGKVCYKDFDNAFYVKTTRGNDLSSETLEQYKLLINIRDSLVNILKLENEGNYNKADKIRKELNEYYDKWVSKFKYFKSDASHKAGDVLHLSDNYVKKLFNNDKYIYLLQSIENYNEQNEFIYKKLGQRNKGVLRFEIDEENDIEEADLDHPINEIEYENSDGDIIKLYQLEDEDYYDVDGYKYKEIINNIKIYDDNNIKSAIFSKPVIINNTNSVNTNDPKLALIYSLQRKGKIDLNYIRSVLDYKLDLDQIVEALNNEIIFDYLSNTYILKDDFISHNVKKKIIDYKNLAENKEKEIKVLAYDIDHNNVDDREIANKKIASLNDEITKINSSISLLVKNKPIDVPFNAINISFGCKWLPLSIYTDFMKKEFNITKDSYTNKDVIYDQLSDEFMINNVRSLSFDISEAIKLEYGFHYDNGKGNKYVSPLDLFLTAINMKTCRLTKYVGTKRNSNDEEVDVYATDEKATQMANSIIKRIKNDFIDYIKNLDEDNKKLVESIYNDKFNLFVKRSYTGKGENLTINGISNSVNLYAYQLDSIYRAILQGNMMFSHSVGAGKTFEMAATGIKFKELGLSNKNMYVVPKNLVPQWQKDFMTLFPNANILVPNDSDFIKENRKKFLSRIATNNFDAVILSYEQFSKIQLSPERLTSYIQQDISDLKRVKDEIIKMASLNGVSKDNVEYRTKIKNINSFIRQREATLKRLYNKKNKDENVVYFDELGIDKLFVDEAHNFKNAYFITKLGNVKGVNPHMTQRTYDMQVKCRYINEMTNYKGVFFGTGTPVSNSIVELYTMMNYLRPDLLQEMNIFNLDSFLANFSGISQDFELDSTGSQFVLESRIKEFTNVPELMNLVNESFDIINKNDLIAFSNNKIKLPEVHRLNIILPETRISKSGTLSLIKRAKRIKNKEVDKHDDNMLKLTTDGKKLALDSRLYDLDSPVDPINKIDAVVHYTTEIYNKYNDRKGTQLIICDYGLPNDKGNFDVYNEIKNNLVKNGIKASEIAFINDYDSPERKTILSKKVNKGEIRVVIGGTQKLGTGMNLQERCIACHHLSIPYRPADIDQREGRIIRQGNKNPNIYIFNYTKQGSFDSRSYSILNVKQQGISQIFSKKSSANRVVKGIDDSGNDTINFVELVACASGDNSIKEILELQQEVDMLKSKKNTLQEQLKKNKVEIETILPKTIKEKEEMLRLYKADFDYYTKNKGENINLKVFGDTTNDVRGVYKTLDEFKEKEGINIFRDRMKEIREKRAGSEVLLAEYNGFRVRAIYNVGEDFKIKFSSPVNDFTHVAEYKFNDCNLARIEKYFSENLPIFIENREEELKEYKADFESKKQAMNTSFADEKVLIEKQEKLKKLMEENANNPDSLLKFNEKGQIDEDSIDLDKTTKLLEKQAEKLDVNVSNFEYEKVDYIEDTFGVYDVVDNVLENNNTLDVENLDDKEVYMKDVSEIKNGCEKTKLDKKHKVVENSYKKY